MVSKTKALSSIGFVLSGCFLAVFQIMTSTVDVSSIIMNYESYEAVVEKSLAFPTLAELASSSSSQQSSSSSSCPDGLFYRSNKLHNNNTANNSENNNNNNNNTQHRQQLIPKIVHQTSKSRCLGPNIYKTSKTWDTIEGYKYYFHDDDAMQKLLETEFKEFPHLPAIARHCLLSGTVKADVWRYLVLWVYGGIYADIDAKPKLFNSSSILPNDDGYFVIEQYHLLSQWFMAVSPRHPLMYYSLMTAIDNILSLPDTGRLDAAFVSGPHALHKGLQMFSSDIGIFIISPNPGKKPVKNGTYYGTANHSIRVVGYAENQNGIINRDAVHRGGVKLREYALMNMTHFRHNKRSGSESNTTCHASILKNEILLASTR